MSLWLKADSLWWFVTAAPADEHMLCAWGKISDVLGGAWVRTREAAEVGAAPPGSDSPHTPTPRLQRGEQACCVK